MNFTARFLALVLFIFIAACSSPEKPPRETFVPLSKRVVALVKQATYEVVVAKESNSSMIFDQDPMGDMPFQKKGDSYVSLGTAFQVGPNRFVSAGHVLQVDTPSLFSVLKLRDVDGKIYTPTQVTRYSNFRDLIEFQVDQPDETRTPLPISPTYTAGQTVFTVGNFEGDGISYRSAETLQSSSEPTEGRWKYIRYFSPVLGGAIGGPLVNDLGQVVGIVVKREEKDRIGFAIPVSELGALSTDHAEFYRKKMVFKTVPKPIERDWIFSPALPKNIELLISEGRASLSDLYKITYAAMAVDKDGKYFPKHKGFRSYTRIQNLGSNIGCLVFDPYGSHWSIQEYKSDHEKELKPEQQVKDYYNRGFIPITVQLPAGGKIGEFNEDPAKVAATMISNNSLGAFSKQGSNSYLMSVGPADHTSVWTDRLGRIWKSAQWYYHDANYGLSTSCTPIPAGSACVVRLGNYANIALEDDYMPQFLDRVIVSYQGTLAQWKSFLSEVDPKLMPESLKTARIDFTPAGNIELHVGHYSYNYPSTQIDNETKLSLKMGYDPNQELGSAVISVDLFPSGDDKEWFAIETRYIPTQDSQDSRISDWKKLSKKSAPYDGVPEYRKTNDATRIMKVLKIHPKSPGEIESASVVICDQPAKRPQDEFLKKCDAFAKSVGVQ